mmetsp:Transcript_25046/g.69798  ORF Transcript_25046/g.69798 Transcript_25046/m.69798 type:complete len:254 (+) Transcript_25046:153-914(+)
MLLRRYFWVLQPVQVDHCDHCPHVQGLQSLLHPIKLHSCASIRVALQTFADVPGLRTCRFRVRVPPPQLEEQSPHESHCESWQMRDTTEPLHAEEATSGPGLQGSTHFMASLHGLPSPLAYCTMCRWRSRTPKHVQLHVDHSSQLDNLQFMSGSHLGLASNLAYSSSRPLTGTPHAFASFSTSRWRDLKAGPQEALGLDHIDHAPQVPLTQLWHGWVLQGTTSDFVFASQSLPPCLGATLTLRLRAAVPPSHG